MTYSFDESVDRSASDAYKWTKYKGQDVLPLWVADMDFKAPPAVLEALQNRLNHGVFGYGETTEAFTNTIIEHAQRAYQWAIDESWIVPLPGLVCGLNVSACAVTEKGQQLLTATPIYPPFMSAGQYAERSVLRVPLLEKNDQRWEWDFDSLEKSITANVRAIMLCHPHNPVGRVWSNEELTQLIRIAEKHKLKIVSDDIHCDLILDTDKKHQPIATLSEYAQQNSITLMAPSKTFNIPGLGSSFAIIPNKALRNRFKQEMNGIVPHINVFGVAATAAAYGESQDWHKALITYLRANRDLLMHELQDYQGLKITKPEATYLAWIDCRALPVDNPWQFFEKHGVGLSNGRDFGLDGFVRLNFGCTKATLTHAIERIKTAISTL